MKYETREINHQLSVAAESCFIQTVLSRQKLVHFQRSSGMVVFGRTAHPPLTLAKLTTPLLHR